MSTPQLNHLILFQGTTLWLTVGFLERSVLSLFKRLERAGAGAPGLAWTAGPRHRRMSPTWVSRRLVQHRLGSNQVVLFSIWLVSEGKASSLKLLHSLYCLY